MRERLEAASCVEVLVRCVREVGCDAGFVWEDVFTCGNENVTGVREIVGEKK